MGGVGRRLESGDGRGGDGGVERRLESGDGRGGKEMESGDGRGRKEIGEWGWEGSGRTWFPDALLSVLQLFNMGRGFIVQSSAQLCGVILGGIQLLL